MTELPEIGKISPEIFSELIFPRLGARSDKVLVGPQHGVDVGIVEIGNKAVSLTTDPVFIVPEYGWERAAWFAIHILASDSVTSGLKPAYLSIDLNLPMEITKEQLTVMWDIMHRECRKLGITVVTGHTARYENCHYPMVGGATVIGVGGKNEYVTPKLAGVGDKIIITKGPAIEATGIFAAMFPQLIEKEFGRAFSRKAEKIFYKMSVVEDAMTAIGVGVRDKGVTAMHDATECGIWGGLYEMAKAGNYGIRAEENLIPIQPVIKKTAELFKFDPFCAISEGTLIAIVDRKEADKLIAAFRKKGILSAVVGEVLPKNNGIKIVKEGKERTLEHPKIDPYWKLAAEFSK